MRWKVQEKGSEFFVMMREITTGPFGEPNPGIVVESARSPERDPPSGIAAKPHPRHKQIQAIALRAVCRRWQRRAAPVHTMKRNFALRAFVAGQSLLELQRFFRLWHRQHPPGPNKSGCPRKG